MYRRPRESITECCTPALLGVRDIASPTVAAVDGPCVGGGLGVAMACDIVLAADDAVLGSPFRNIGIMLDAGGHYFLRDHLGHHKASQIIYTSLLYTPDAADEDDSVDSVTAHTIHKQTRQCDTCL